MEYLITLKNGETRTIRVLKVPLFPCIANWEGSILYKTFSEIEGNKDIEFVSKTDPHWLYNDVCGVIRGETELFDIYKSLKNKIVKLEVIE